MNPEIAKTLVEQRREELTRTTADARRNRNGGPSWLSRHLPRWHVSWTRTVLPPAEAGLRWQREPGPSRQGRIVPDDHHLGPPLGRRASAGLAARAWIPRCRRSGLGTAAGDISGLLQRRAADQIARR